MSERTRTLSDACTGFLGSALSSSFNDYAGAACAAVTIAYMLRRWWIMEKTGVKTDSEE